MQHHTDYVRRSCCRLKTNSQLLSVFKPCQVGNHQSGAVASSADDGDEQDCVESGLTKHRAMDEDADCE